MSEIEIGSSLVEDYAIYAASISAIISALIVIYRKAVKPVIKHFKEWYDMMDKIDYIFKEVKPNEGSSIKDKIDQIDLGLTFVGERFRAYLADSKEAHFETDAEGNCTRVNRTYTRLVEREPSEILGQGWQNCISQQDRQYVVDAWQHAVDDHRELTLNFHFETPSGTIIPVRGTSYKMVNQKGEVIGYLGKVIKRKPNDNRV